MGQRVIDRQLERWLERIQSHLERHGFAVEHDVLVGDRVFRVVADRSKWHALSKLEDMVLLTHCEYVSAEELREISQAAFLEAQARRSTGRLVGVLHCFPLIVAATPPSEEAVWALGGEYPLRHGLNEQDIEFPLVFTCPMNGVSLVRGSTLSDSVPSPCHSAQPRKCSGRRDRTGDPFVGGQVHLTAASPALTFASRSGIRARRPLYFRSPSGIDTPGGVTGTAPVTCMDSCRRGSSPVGDDSN